MAPRLSSAAGVAFSGKPAFPAAFVLVCLLPVGGCEPAAERDEGSPPAATIADKTSEDTTYVFECDGLDFVARAGAKRAVLFLESGTVTLPRKAVPRGLLFADAHNRFWIRGEVAQLDSGASSYRDCVNNRALAIWEHAKLAGVDFRGLGNEPGWTVEITDKGTPGKIEFTGDYGATRSVFVDVERRTWPDERRTTYRASSVEESIEVELHGAPCRDTMSGAAFETTVVVRFGGREFRGCGKPLH